MRWFEKAVRQLDVNHDSPRGKQKTPKSLRLSGMSQDAKRRLEWIEKTLHVLERNDDGCVPQQH